VRLVALIALLAACSGPTPAPDAGPSAIDSDGGPRPTTGLYRPTPPPAAPGPRRCPRGYDAFHYGELSLGSRGDLRLGPGALPAREPVFAMEQPAEAGESGLLYPMRHDDATLPMVRGAMRAAPFGSGFVVLDPGDGEIVMIDPLAGEPRLRAPLEVPGPDVAVSARDGGALLAWGALTYQPLDARLEVAGEPVSVDVGVSLGHPHLVRTDVGVVALATASCGPVVHPLDAAGAPADEPYCLDLPGAPSSDPLWDGARVVWTFDTGVVELDGRGSVAAWTPAREVRPVVAFGAADSVVVLRDVDEANARPGVVALERGTGAVIRGLGVAGFETSPKRIASASVAVVEGSAWFVYRPAASSNVGSVVVDCAAE